MLGNAQFELWIVDSIKMGLINRYVPPSRLRLQLMQGYIWSHPLPPTTKKKHTPPHSIQGTVGYSAALILLDNEGQKGTTSLYGQRGAYS